MTPGWDANGSPVEPVPLDTLLADEPIGSWVVLDPGMTRVLARGADPEAVLKAAFEGTTEPPWDEPRPILMQVHRGPLNTYLYRPMPDAVLALASSARLR